MDRYERAVVRRRCRPIWRHLTLKRRAMASQGCEESFEFEVPLDVGNSHPSEVTLRATQRRRAAHLTGSECLVSMPEIPTEEIRGVTTGPAAVGVGQTGQGKRPQLGDEAADSGRRTALEGHQVPAVDSPGDVTMMELVELGKRWMATAGVPGFQDMLPRRLDALLGYPVMVARGHSTAEGIAR